MKALVFLTVLACASLGCTSSTSSGGSGGTSGIAIDDLSTTLIDHICTAFTNCPLSKSGDGVNVATVEGCKAILNGEGMGDLTKMVAAVKAGTITYDAASAQECVAAMANCNAFSQKEQPAACAAAFIGTIAEKGVCTLSEQCVSGFCKVTQGCGACAVRGAEGAACANSDKECAAGLVCNQQKCAKSGISGKLGGDCHGSSDCPSGSYCGMDKGASKQTCLAQIDSGASCTGSGQCKTGFYCLPGTSGGSCTAVAKAGDACTVVQGLDPMQPCDDTSVCIAGKDGKGTCKVFVGLASACGDSLECRGMDLVCTDSKCAIIGAKGATCVAPTSQFKPLACLPGLTCSSGKCIDAPAVGQPCPDHQCAAGASCQNGTCKGLPGNGEACFGACADGFYCDMSGASGTANCKAISCK